MSHHPTPIHEIPGRTPNFDRFPAVEAGPRGACWTGWDAICGEIRRRDRRVVVIEAYPGVYDKDLRRLVDGLGADVVLDTATAFRPAAEIDRMVEPDVTDDPVFGYLTRLTVDEFLDPGAVARLRAEAEAARGTVVVYGTGASRVVRGDLLVYFDLTRREAQLRQRRDEVPNLGSANHLAPAPEQYKRAYFVDWRVGDRLKRSLWDRMDLVVDSCDPQAPKMIEGRTLLDTLSRTARRPFRVVPWFDPAPWGGQWMKQVCDLDKDASNYGWCFDCVPEENSLLLDFGGARFETPSLNLVFREPLALLGDAVYGRFGDEFPIRFDFLDTMGGGNLSLQVHPLTEYIQHSFGMHYTQDESYYILDAEEDASVFLGVRDDVDRAAMLEALRRAERGEEPFDAERFVNRFPAKRHDHFLIPAGTIHCSSRCMVLEISATPYIFTFKLWDWDRPGLDGKPRPVHIDHGERVIRWERNTTYARRRLINRIWQVAEGDGWIEERTGLHEAEFIETRRHWFTKPAPHAAGDGVAVLNLIEGEEAVVESPDNAFDPFVVHYAETFIVPAAAGPYTIRPHGRGEGTRCGTIKASVRTNP